MPSQETIEDMAGHGGLDACEREIVTSAGMGNVCSEGGRANAWAKFAVEPRVRVAQARPCRWCCTQVYDEMLCVEATYCQRTVHHMK